MQQTILAQIIHDKEAWVAQRQQQQPLTEFYHSIQPSQRHFYQALSAEKTHFILECKKASPSKGLLREHFDLAQIADTYRHYASAISVLTDEKYFQGDFRNLPQISNLVPQPVLCKDFIIDPYQIFLARYYQADAILLMLSVLNDQQYKELSSVAHRLEMGVLTEVSNEDELERAIQLGARVVGINNRDLRDLSIDLQRTPHLASKLPTGTTIISESGIYTHQQVKKLKPFVNGFLIGSALMAAQDLNAAVRRVIFGENKVCGLTRAKDAETAYQAGAYYGGLIFVEQSPRSVTLPQAQQIIKTAPLQWVGVFRNAPIDTIKQKVDTLSLAAVQLHGDEDETYITALRQQLPDSCQLWKALAVGDSLPARKLPYIDRYLFDNGTGGTGQAFDWSLLAGEDLSNVMLAGGLCIDNLGQALQLDCLGLDFNSGVETEPGIKDLSLIKQVFAQLTSV